MNQKTLIIVVIILVVVFLIGTGAGFIRKEGEGTDEQGTPVPLKLDVSWIEGIGNVFSPRIGKNDVDPASTCGQNAIEDKSLTLSAPNTCTFIFLASDTRSRLLEIQLELGGAPVGQVKYDPIPESASDFPVNKTLNTAEADIRLSVRRRGGTLTLGCTSGTCLFGLNP